MHSQGALRAPWGQQAPPGPCHSPLQAPEITLASTVHTRALGGVSKEEPLPSPEQHGILPGGLQERQVNDPHLGQPPGAPSRSRYLPHVRACLRGRRLAAQSDSSAVRMGFSPHQTDHSPDEGPASSSVPPWARGGPAYLSQLSPQSTRSASPCCKSSTGKDIRHTQSTLLPTVAPGLDPAAWPRSPRVRALGRLLTNVTATRTKTPGVSVTPAPPGQRSPWPMGATTCFLPGRLCP